MFFPVHAKPVFAEDGQSSATTAAEEIAELSDWEGEWTSFALMPEHGVEEGFAHIHFRREELQPAYNTMGEKEVKTTSFYAIGELVTGLEAEACASINS